jgi:hypothetical protein
MIKIGIAFAIAAAVGAMLVIAASGARERGRNTYCRNNLRKLGDMAFQKVSAEEQRNEGGRAFWQAVRVENFTTVKGGQETWVVRFGGLNPFGCPVRGVQPLDLSELSPEELARHMSDPTTIDYRGPKFPAVSPPPKLEPLGADLEGNHPGGGGYVLLVDLSIREVREAVQVKELRDAPGATGGLSD